VVVREAVLPTYKLAFERIGHGPVGPLVDEVRP